MHTSIELGIIQHFRVLLMLGIFDKGSKNLDLLLQYQKMLEAILKKNFSGKNLPGRDATMAKNMITTVFVDLEILNPEFCCTLVDRMDLSGLNFS